MKFKGIGKQERYNYKEEIEIEFQVLLVFPKLFKPRGVARIYIQRVNNSIKNGKFPMDKK